MNSTTLLLIAAAAAFYFLKGNGSTGGNAQNLQTSLIGGPLDPSGQNPLITTQPQNITNFTPQSVNDVKPAPGDKLGDIYNKMVYATSEIGPHSTGLQADTWNFYLKQASGYTGPDPASVGLPTSYKITIDQYWKAVWPYLNTTYGVGVSGLGVWAV